MVQNAIALSSTFIALVIRTTWSLHLHIVADDGIGLDKVEDELMGVSRVLKKISEVIANEEGRLRKTFDEYRKEFGEQVTGIRKHYANAASANEEQMVVLRSTLQEMAVLASDLQKFGRSLGAKYKPISSKLEDFTSKVGSVVEELESSVLSPDWHSNISSAHEALSGELEKLRLEVKRLRRGRFSLPNLVSSRSSNPTGDDPDRAKPFDRLSRMFQSWRNN